MAEKRRIRNPQKRFWEPPPNLPLGFEMLRTSVYGRFEVLFMERYIGYLEREPGAHGKKWHIKTDLNGPIRATVSTYPVALQQLKSYSRIPPDKNGFPRSTSGVETDAT